MSTTAHTKRFKDDAFRFIPGGFILVAIVNYLLTTQDIWFGQTVMLNNAQASMAIFIPHLTIGWVAISLLMALYYRFHKPVSLVAASFILTTLPMILAMAPPAGAADVLLQR